jgi:hypothetical protein
MREFTPTIKGTTSGILSVKASPGYDKKGNPVSGDRWAVLFMIMKVQCCRIDFVLICDCCLLTYWVFEWMR